MRRPTAAGWRPPQPARSPPADAAAGKSPAELAKEALGYANSDFVFDGSMEGNFDRGYAAFAEFVKGIGADSGLLSKRPDAHRLIIR